MKDRIIFLTVIIFLMGLSWFTVSVVDNHEKWQNCSWAPHEFIYEGDYNSQQWGKCGLHTCRNCGFQYIQLYGVSTNGITENVMAIKSVFSNDFCEYYIEYNEKYSLPKYIRVKEESIKPVKSIH